MKTWQEATSSASGRLDRLTEPLAEAAHRLTGAVGDARYRLADARESAGETIAVHPLRWTLTAFVAGLIVGALITSRHAGD